MDSQSNRQFRPISDDFYDELETAATTQQRSEITFRDEDGMEQQVSSDIKDLFTEHGVEYARLENRIIRLDSIVRLNGKTIGGSTDTERLQSGNYADNDTATVRDNQFVGDVSDIGRTGISTENAIRHGEMHQHERIADNLLGKDAVNEQHTTGYEIRQDNEPDFAHEFSVSPGPFVLADNDRYRLTADRIQNRLYLTAKQNWYEAEDVPELGANLVSIAPFMGGRFSFLNDLTGLTPEPDGTLMSPAIPNKSVLLGAGLTKVADLVPPACETLVHGIDSFSVNSVPLRSFKERAQAEHWLTDDHVGTETSEKNLGLD